MEPGLNLIKILMVFNSIAFFLYLIFDPEMANIPALMVCFFVLLCAYAEYKVYKDNKDK